MIIKNFRYDAAVRKILGNTNSNFFMNQYRATGISMVNTLFKDSQLSDLDYIAAELSTSPNDSVSSLDNGITVSVKHTSYFSERRNVIKDVFSKEGVAVEFRGQKSIFLSSIDNRSEISRKVIELETLRREMEPMREIVAKTTEIEALMAPITEEIVYKSVALLRDKIQNNGAIYQGVVVLEQDGLEIFRANHTMTLKDVSMSVVLGNGSNYKKLFERLAVAYKDVFDQHLTGKETYQALFTSVSKAYNQKSILFLPDVIKFEALKEAVRVSNLN